MESAILKVFDGPCAALESRSSDDGQTSPGPGPGKNTKELQLKISKELPPLPLSATISAPTRPISTRASIEIFQTRSTGATIEDEYDDEGDRKSKRSSGKRFSATDSSSLYTVDSKSTNADENGRLSGRMKKAWRGVKGGSSQQKRGDPLEEWMVRHSGGTFRSIAHRGVDRDSGDK